MCKRGYTAVVTTNTKIKLGSFKSSDNTNENENVIMQWFQLLKHINDPLSLAKGAREKYVFLQILTSSRLKKVTSIQ